MFAYLRGAVAASGTDFVVLDVNGVGFRVTSSWQTISKLPAQGELCTLYTYLYVREDAMALFGFSTEAELQCFEMLISVTGVGPRVAVAILSELSYEEFAFAVASKDVKKLTMASGVGNKLAQHIIMELADKLAKESFLPSGGRIEHAAPRSGDNADEAVSALAVLGYSQTEALRAVRSFNTEGLSSEEIIKAALKLLMRQ